MTTLDKHDTELCADSVEWCPFDPYKTTLLCGTYQLQDKPQNESDGSPQVRLGHLRVYQLKMAEQISLHLTQTIPMPGILDIKWCKRKIDDAMLFGLVNSVGELQIWQFKDPDSPPLKTHCVTLNEDCLGLSLDWTHSTNSECQKIAASDSKCFLSVYQVDSKQIHCLGSWKAHDFEAWICGFNIWDDSVVFSGGDDCKLKAWDCRIGYQSPVFSKRFDMGVCSMQCNSSTDQCMIAVGGYDEQVRIYDTRNMKKNLSEVKLGGGVWRIKWQPITGDKILTATMYNGFHILDASNPSSSLSIIQHYKDGEHGSLGYGADWCYNQTNSVIATCSFYDHSLHVWSNKVK